MKVFQYDEKTEILKIKEKESIVYIKKNLI